MDSNISSNNENTPKKETIVIPPEPVKQPEIPATFNSPALFEKEEVKKKPEITEYPKSKNYKKTLLVLIGVIVFIAIGIFSINQISTQFATFVIRISITSQNENLTRHTN